MFIDHWESSPCIPTLFPTLMPFYKFKLLDKFFQINSEKGQTDKSLKKVEPLLSMFHQFSKFYKPSSKLCIDETIAPFMGRFKYLSYNPQKPKKWGIKIIGIADSETSYCLSMVPYLGSETFRYYNVKNLNELVLKHMKEFASPQSCLYIDNYYCNFTLAEKMLFEGFNVTGTFRLDRKDVPAMIKEAEVKTNVLKPSKKASASRKDIRYFQNDKGVYAVKWKAKKVVSVLTTNHSMESSVKVTARDREVNRPNVIHEYVNYMRGIDRLNQRISYIR